MGSGRMMARERSRSDERGRRKERSVMSSGSSKVENFCTPEVEPTGGRKNDREPRAPGQEAREAHGSKDTLEEALEKEMEDWMKRAGFKAVNPWQREVDRLKDENMEILKMQNSRLLQEVERLRQENMSRKEEVGASEWSAVSPPYVREGSPVRGERERCGDGLRFTPGGTQVPSGPPPGDVEVRVPEFPWSSAGVYEEVQRDCRKGVMGDWQWTPKEIWGEPGGWDVMKKEDDMKAGPLGARAWQQDELCRGAWLPQGDRALQQDELCRGAWLPQGDRALQRDELCRGAFTQQGDRALQRDGVYHGPGLPREDRAWQEEVEQEKDVRHQEVWKKEAEKRAERLEQELENLKRRLEEKDKEIGDGK